MSRSLLLSATIVGAFCASAHATPQVITPTVVFSVHDEPVDGAGDSFNLTPFEGLIRTQSTRADRALQEYDVSALAGQFVSSAILYGRVAVNNAFDNGIRTFDFKLYQGNGTAELADYQITATLIGTGQYHPPIDTSFTYQFDITGAVQALLAGGGTWVGLRVEGSSNPNFPNILVEADCHLDIVVSTPPGIPYCTPGAAGVIACPCANPPAGANRGCDNSEATGGASISSSGVPSLGSDTLAFTTAGQCDIGSSIVLQGTLNDAGGLAFGQGVRCVSGSLKRLYVLSATGGSISAPTGGDPSVSVQSLNLGDPILAGEHRYYMVYYRDPVVLGGCPATATYNGTNALDVTWSN